MPDEMYVVRLENDCLKDITRTLRRCRLLIKMKGMKHTRELYLIRRPPTGARKSITGPTPEKDNAANPEAPHIIWGLVRDPGRAPKCRMKARNGNIKKTKRSFNEQKIQIRNKIMPETIPSQKFGKIQEESI